MGKTGSSRTRRRSWSRTRKPQGGVFRLYRRASHDQPGRLWPRSSPAPTSVRACFLHYASTVQTARRGILFSKFFGKQVPPLDGRLAKSATIAAYACDDQGGAHSYGRRIAAGTSRLDLWVRGSGRFHQQAVAGRICNSNANKRCSGSIPNAARNAAQTPGDRGHRSL